MYRARVDFGVNIAEFRNSELFQPGLYLVRLSLFYEDEDVRYFAKPSIEPTVHSEQQAQQSQNRAAIFHNLKEASAVSDSGYLYSNTFLIRYADERVNLNHMAKFEALVNT